MRQIEKFLATPAGQTVCVIVLVLGIACMIALEIFNEKWR